MIELRLENGQMLAPELLCRIFARNGVAVFVMSKCQRHADVAAVP